MRRHSRGKQKMPMKWEADSKKGTRFKASPSVAPPIFEGDKRKREERGSFPLQVIETSRFSSNSNRPCPIPACIQSCSCRLGFPSESPVGSRNREDQQVPKGILAVTLMFVFTVVQDYGVELVLKKRVKKI
ncbi:hypothetical protein OPV22_024063 [Ensete ventricosum]|uniref:Uncharacterized protein n=1 Tax=Ensete ventricosum TaxID=4639 RepID=A0AAV8PDD9_ENSVE|nr:hypothetical protein OPV22_024063 [Ensete ventricosum]